MSGGEKAGPGSGPDLYSKGNEAFVSEDYPLAVEQYSAALALEPHYPECLVARSHAHIKTEKYEAAKRDADKAIDLLRAGAGGTGPLASKAFLRSGVASFHLGRYREAQNCFQAGQQQGEEAGLTQWLQWCGEKIEKFGDCAPGVKQTSVKPAAEIKKVGEPPATSEDKTKVETAGVATAVEANQMPVPKISHDWYQTESQVVVEVRVKKVAAADCKIDMTETTLSVTAKLPSGSEYSLELDLAHPILPLQSSYKILSTKIEIKLKKSEGVRWAALEGDGTAPLPGGVVAPAASQAGVKGPYASGRDWAAIEKNIAAEAEEKKEGEAALNEMFQKIYGDANDEVKRAMNKSFQESGGTVLSTNWGDIGKEKTEVKPPDGMEWKKWD